MRGDPCPLATPKPTFALLILYRHRNPPAIVAVVERRDLQSAAETKLQPPVGSEPRRRRQVGDKTGNARGAAMTALQVDARRSEEHTSELQSLMRISYAVFCLQKQTTT